VTGHGKRERERENDAQVYVCGSTLGEAGDRATNNDVCECLFAGRRVHLYIWGGYAKEAAFLPGGFFATVLGTKTGSPKSPNLALKDRVDACTLLRSGIEIDPFDL
jgi:hypothetical protein